MVADGTINERFAAVASGTPIECPPPSTRDTVGFLLDDIISAIEKGVIDGREHLSAMYKYRNTYGAN